MFALAWLFVLAGGLPLLAIAATAKPVRAENLMGFHLVVLPMVLALTLGLGLAIAAEWRQTVLPATALYASLPGWFVAVVVMTFACFDRKNVRLVQLLMLLAIASPVALLAGGDAHPRVQLAGGVYVVALGMGAVLVAAGRWVTPRWQRYFARRAARGVPPSPDSFEGQQWARQRDDWAQRGMAAGFVELLAFTRAANPEVRSASVARLVATPDFEASLAQALEENDSRDAMAAVRELSPKQRAMLAPQLAPRLDEVRERFQRRVAAGEDPAAEIEVAMRLLDAGVGSYLGGGKLRRPLAQWKGAFGSHPSSAKYGKELRMVLWLVRARRLFLGVK